MGYQAYREGSIAPEIRAHLDELVAVLDGAISLQPETEQVVRACLAEDPKNATLARKAAHLSATWTDLVGRTNRLPPSVIADEARRLIRDHHRVLTDSVGFAYSVLAILHRCPAPFGPDELNEPEIHLRRLRNLIVGYLRDDSSHRPSVDEGANRRPSLFSHRVRTPLTTILGNASSLLQPDVHWDHDSEDRLLRGILTESTRLARMVDNTLDLCSIDSGTLRPDFDWCDPAAIVDAAVVSVAGSLSNQGQVTVNMALPDTWAPHGFIWADHTLLVRAVGNIVENALRHNPPATTVTVTARLDTDHVAISITDNGPGLPADVASAVTTATTAGLLPTDIGTGIATAIGLVRAHGGTVSFPPTTSGTSCTIRLPVDTQYNLSGPIDFGRPDDEVG